MARRSLWPLAMLASAAVLTGCLDSAPEYSVPELVSPQLDEADSYPSIAKLYNIGTSKIDVGIPIRFDTRGGRVRVFFLLDYEGGDTGIRLCEQNPLPGVLVVGCAQDIPDGLSPGCHTITALASYESNFVNGWATITDPLLATQATWFVSIGTPDVACFRGGMERDQ